MIKTTSDHLIKQYGFTPLVIEAEFRPNVSLDFYESKVGKANVVGFVAPHGWSTRVILDTKNNDQIPFSYIYTYADLFGKNVHDAIDRKIREENAKAELRQRLQEEAKLQISPEQREIHHHILSLKAKLNLLHRRLGLRPFGTRDNNGIDKVIQKLIDEHKAMLKTLEKQLTLCIL